MTIIGLAKNNDDETRRDLTLAMARLAGCNCNPNIGDVVFDGDGLGSASVSHDDWCGIWPEIRRGRRRYN